MTEDAQVSNYTKFRDHVVATLMYDRNPVMVTAATLNKVHKLEKPDKPCPHIHQNSRVTQEVINIPHPRDPILNESLVRYWHEVIEEQPWKEDLLPQNQHGDDIPRSDEELLDILTGAAPWPNGWNPAFRRQHKMQGLPWFLNRTSGLPLDAAAFHQPWMTNLRENESLRRFIGHVMRRRIAIAHGIAITTHNLDMLYHGIPPIPDEYWIENTVFSCLERSFLVLKPLAQFRPYTQRSRHQRNAAHAANGWKGRGWNAKKKGYDNEKKKIPQQQQQQQQSNSSSSSNSNSSSSTPKKHSSSSAASSAASRRDHFLDVQYDSLRVLHGIFCLTPCILQESIPGPPPSHTPLGGDMDTTTAHPTTATTTTTTDPQSSSPTFHIISHIISSPGTFVILPDAHPAPYERYTISTYGDYNVACGLFMTWVLDQSTTTTANLSSPSLRESSRNRTVRKKTENQYTSERSMVNRCISQRIVPPLSSASKFLSIRYNWVPMQMIRRPYWFWHNMYPMIRLPNKRIGVTTLLNEELKIETTTTTTGTIGLDSTTTRFTTITTHGDEAEGETMVESLGDEQPVPQTEDDDDNNERESSTNYEAWLCRQYMRLSEYGNRIVQEETEEPAQVPQGSSATMTTTSSPSRGGGGRGGPSLAQAFFFRPY